MNLYAPKTYWEATKEERKAVCNGCGAKGGINVPDTMYGLSITQSCNIHDWMFKEGVTYADMMFANAMFLLNLTIEIIAGSNWATKPMRLMRATKYFLAVIQFGSDAYWVDKEPNDDMSITFSGTFGEIERA